jgi:hypothetical protein
MPNQRLARQLDQRQGWRLARPGGGEEADEELTGDACALRRTKRRVKRSRSIVPLIGRATIIRCIALNYLVADYRKRHVRFNDDVLTGRSHSDNFRKKHANSVVCHDVQILPELLFSCIFQFEGLV